MSHLEDLMKSLRGEGDDLHESALPKWVQKLRAGVTQDQKAHHKHILTQLSALKPVLAQLLRLSHGAFEPADIKAIEQFQRMLSKYEYPIAGVKVKEEEPLILF